jgi:prefoldin subunit 5
MKLLALFAVAIVALGSGVQMPLQALVAQASVDEKKPEANKPEEAGKPEHAEKKSRSEKSESDRKAAMQFATQHHPELARLLEQLEKSRPNEFARAIRDLNQQLQQLERTREKSPARYEAQLESWKTESQIRVLTARWSLSRDPELETQIRGLLKQRREAKMAQLKADKERLLEQQRKIDEQLSALSDPMDAQVDKEWEQLAKKAGLPKNGGKKAPEPTAAADKK